MEFLKNHYEKVLLSVVLLGLAVAAAALPLQVSRLQEYLDNTVKGFVRTPPKPYKAMDLTTNVAAMKRLDGPIEFRLSGPHNLFNPVRWKVASGGTWIKVQTGAELGPGALKVNSIYPLHLVVTFDGVSGSADNPRYQLTVLRENEGKMGKKTPKTATLAMKNDLFTLLAVRPQDNPTEVDIKMGKENEVITVSRDKPYTKVVGYASDLFYPPEKQDLKNSRVNDRLTLRGDSDSYKIVAIDPDEVVLSASSTGKRTTLNYSKSTTQ